MFEVPKAMLTIDRRGLVFGDRHILAAACAQTGTLDIDQALPAVLTQLSCAYGRQMDERAVQKLVSAADAWNRGDHGRAAYDLIVTGLPDPRDDAKFYERLDLVAKAFAQGHHPAEIVKAAGGNMAWIGEARVPAGQNGGGEWSNGNGGSDSDNGSVIDVSARQHDPCNDKNAVAFVKKYHAEATAIGAEYGVNGNYILGLAARESGYGVVSLFVKDNAFFNLEKSLPEDQEPTQADINSIPRATGMKRSAEKTWNPILKKYTYAWVYTFNSFADSTRSFLDRYAKDVAGKKSSKEFLQALQNANFNNKPEFLDTKVFEKVMQRLKCPG